MKIISEEQYAKNGAKLAGNSRDEEIAALYASVPKLTEEQTRIISEKVEAYLIDLESKYGKTDTWSNGYKKANTNSMQYNFEFRKVVQIAEEILGVNSDTWDKKIVIGFTGTDYIYPFSNMISEKILSPLIQKRDLGGVLYD